MNENFSKKIEKAEEGSVVREINREERAKILETSKRFDIGIENAKRDALKLIDNNLKEGLKIKEILSFQKIYPQF